MADVLSESQKGFFLRTLAARIVPESQGLDAAGQARFFSILEAAIASRPPAMRRQIALFLQVLRWLPALRFGASLDRLDPLRQDSALQWFHGCPVPLLRQGFWGVKTLVMMGYYGREEIGPALGYTPSKRGNEILSRPLPPSPSIPLPHAGEGGRRPGEGTSAGEKP